MFVYVDKIIFVAFLFGMFHSRKMWAYTYVFLGVIINDWVFNFSFSFLTKQFIYTSFQAVKYKAASHFTV